jgi:hypothetical protein
VATPRQAKIKVPGLGELSIREYRSNLAKLKKAGLVSQRIDARSHKPTRYMRKQMAKFASVIKGNAKAVKAPSRKAAKEYSALRPTKFNRVVMPVGKNERVYWSKRNGAIVAVRHTGWRGAEYVRTTIYPRKPDEIPALEPGQTYVIPWAQGGDVFYQRVANQEQLMEIILRYENAPDKRARRNTTQKWSNIRSYIGVVDISSEL